MEKLSYLSRTMLEPRRDLPRVTWLLVSQTIAVAYLRVLICWHLTSLQSLLLLRLPHAGRQRYETLLAYQRRLISLAQYGASWENLPENLLENLPKNLPRRQLLAL